MTDAHDWLPEYLPLVDALRETGADFHRRGWSLGTISNYSAVVNRDPLHLLITASGKDKGRLTRADFLLVGADGRSIEPAAPPLKPSAETPLHVVVAHHTGAGAILHTHSPWATVLSDLYFEQGHLVLEGFEMLKGLEGVSTHEDRIRVPIFENTEDIVALAGQIQTRLAEPFSCHGFLIRRHGLYTWGRTIEAARRHVEVLEFLFDVIGRYLSAGIRSTHGTG